MSDIFSRIIAREIPSYTIYEDEWTYAFLDIFPQMPGHTLIVPKIEVDHFSEVPEPYYSAIFQTAKKLSPALQKATGCTRVCGAFLGFDVPHCHFHLIPSSTIEDIHWQEKKSQADAGELAIIQERIRAFL